MLVSHLSRPAVTYRLKRVKSIAERAAILAISLQQTGFTALVRHRTKLWALTVIFTKYLKNYSA